MDKNIQTAKATFVGTPGPEVNTATATFVGTPGPMQTVEHTIPGVQGPAGIELRPGEVHPIIGPDGTPQPGGLGYRPEVHPIIGPDGKLPSDFEFHPIDLPNHGPGGILPSDYIILPNGNITLEGPGGKQFSDFIVQPVDLPSCGLPDTSKYVKINGRWYPKIAFVSPTQPAVPSTPVTPTIMGKAEEPIPRNLLDEEGPPALEKTKKPVCVTVDTNVVDSAASQMNGIAKSLDDSAAEMRVMRNRLADCISCRGVESLFGAFDKLTNNVGTLASDSAFISKGLTNVTEKVNETKTACESGTYVPEHGQDADTLYSQYKNRSL